MIENIKSEEEELLLTEEEREDLESVEREAKPVSYTGQDFDVDGLVKRLINRDILIPTFGHDDEDIEAAGFQRAFVWRRPQMDKFIESILLGYPIPGVFLVKQSDNRYLVLDGQQRLLTLRFFRDGIYEGREYSLRNVADEFKNLTYKSLPEDLRRQFDNTFIQAIIVSSDGSTESMEAIYHIFERLNSGGTQLTAHEIRVALFAGPFIDFLELLNTGEHWRELYGNKSPRLRDQELVLRVFGLMDRSSEYRRPLKKFLNDVVADHRDQGAEEHSSFTSLFQNACKVLVDSAGRVAIRVGKTQVNSALAEAVLVGLMQRLSNGEDNLPPESVIAAISEFKREAIDAISKATADESQVQLRILTATQIFSKV
ncbi:MAG: DUF262 domain-containing protein [Spirochaetales bacterium]|jgi:hypothetical protein|nr:DUF262 domain-containing protein [Spirochaetales bacterium]